MSHEPPPPDAAVSPYPLQPSPMPERAGPDADGADGEADQSWAERARGAFDLAKEHKVALGAAAGIGSAGLLAALMFARRSGRSEDRATSRVTRRPRRKTGSA